MIGDGELLFRRQKTEEISKIGPDLMLIKPWLVGDYTLELSYQRPFVEYLGYATTFVTVLVLAILVFKKRNFKMSFESKELKEVEKKADEDEEE